MFRVVCMHSLLYRNQCVMIKVYLQEVLLWNTCAKSTTQSTYLLPYTWYTFVKHLVFPTEVFLIPPYIRKRQYQEMHMEMLDLINFIWSIFIGPFDLFCRHSQCLAIWGRDLAGKDSPSTTLSCSLFLLCWVVYRYGIRYKRQRIYRLCNARELKCINERTFVFNSWNRWMERIVIREFH